MGKLALTNTPPNMPPVACRKNRLSLFLGAGFINGLSFINICFMNISVMNEGKSASHGLSHVSLITSSL
jgi:hypothetical protein